MKRSFLWKYLPVSLSYPSFSSSLIDNSYSMEMDEVTYSRRLLENPTSARKYSQVFAVAALLCELHTGLN
jgi:hypothetical protein